MANATLASWRRFAGNSGKALAAVATAVLALVASGSVANAQTAFPGCTASMFLSQSPNGDPNMTLYRFQTNTNPFTYTPLGASSTIYNATAFNPGDNFLYGIAGGDLVRVGSNGRVANLGDVPGLPNTGFLAGEIGPGNTYYVLQGNNSTTLYAIDLTNPSNPTVTSIGLNRAVSVFDLAWHGGLLYGAAGGNLYSINPVSGTVSTVGSTGVGGTFGAMFGTPDNVYGANNAGTGFYQFDVNNGSASLISNAPGASTNDGAKCYSTPLSFSADLAITKTDGQATYPPGESVQYDIVVSNTGPFGAQGAVTTDPLPSGITTASWACGNATGAGACAASSGSAANGNAIDGAAVSLPVGASVTFTLTLDVPVGFTGDLVNTATVSPSEGTTDDNNANNTASDTDVADPVLTLVKDLTNDNGGSADLADFTLSATSGDGSTTISGASGTAAVTQVAVPEGTYTLDETNQPGYTAGDYSCVVNGAAAVSGNSVALANGDRAVCTVANDDDPATLTLQKTVTNDNGGTSVAGDFTLTATGPDNSISGVDGDPAVTAAEVSAGAYTLSESGPDGYTANYSCVVNGVSRSVVGQFEIPG